MDPTYGGFGGGLGNAGGGYASPYDFMGAASMMGGAGYGGGGAAPSTNAFAPGATPAAGPAAGQDFPGSGQPQGLPWWMFNQPSTGTMPAMTQAPLQEGMQLQLTPQYAQQNQQNQQQAQMKKMLAMSRMGMGLMQGRGWGGIPQSGVPQGQTPGYGGGGFY